MAVNADIQPVLPCAAGLWPIHIQDTVEDLELQSWPITWSVAEQLALLYYSGTVS